MAANQVKFKMVAFYRKITKKITIKLELMYLELTGAPWRACVDKGLNLTLDHVDHP